jgi:heme-degrading monooxygenase HmoA
VRTSRACALWSCQTRNVTIVTVFRSRLRPGVEEPYEEVAARMGEIAQSMTGFIDQTFYLANDGERVTIVRFEDRESHRAWAEHPEHLATQRRGRDDFYSWYASRCAKQRTIACSNPTRRKGPPRIRTESLAVLERAARTAGRVNHSTRVKGRVL